MPPTYSDIDICQAGGLGREAGGLVGRIVEVVGEVRSKRVEENIMGKLGKILHAIGRFVNGAIKDMAADKAGARMSDGDEEMGT